MIDTREIFDDIGESLAVQEYAQEVAEKAVTNAVAQAKLESALAMLAAGIPIEKVASILHLSVEQIIAARS
ncbi:MAG: hypothetical protein H9535_02110 [Ignavibacteria bacterium]|nr:hypothetical protein [Ignavibacteria bacterium]